MAQQTIDGSLSFAVNTGRLNSNFTELYASSGGPSEWVDHYDGTLATEASSLFKHYPWANETVTGWRITAGVMPTGSGVTVDLEKNGVQVDQLTISAGGAETVSDTTLNVSLTTSDWLGWRVTAIGSSTPGGYLTVQVRRTPA